MKFNGYIGSVIFHHAGLSQSRSDSPSISIAIEIANASNRVKLIVSTRTRRKTGGKKKRMGRKIQLERSRKKKFHRPSGAIEVIIVLIKKRGEK